MTTFQIGDRVRVVSELPLCSDIGTISCTHEGILPGYTVEGVATLPLWFSAGELEAVRAEHKDDE